MRKIIETGAPWLCSLINERVIGLSARLYLAARIKAELFFDANLSVDINCNRYVRYSVTEEGSGGWGVGVGGGVEGDWSW